MGNGKIEIMSYAKPVTPHLYTALTAYHSPLKNLKTKRSGTADLYL
jgi:hypothetical protein